MVRPAPGYLSGGARQRFLEGRERLFFAHSAVSGLSLFEAMQYRGVRAADRASVALAGCAAGDESAEF